MILFFNTTHNTDQCIKYYRCTNLKLVELKIGVYDIQTAISSVLPLLTETKPVSVKCITYTIYSKD